jgi:hypothetical protein
MKKKLIVGFILIMFVFCLSGCNEQKVDDNGNVDINYDYMQRFAGVWLNQTSSIPEYFLITEDGKIFVLDKQQGISLIDDYENYSKIVLNWDSYEKYRLIDDYYELYDFKEGKFYRYATYYFEDDYNTFIFNVINNGDIIIYSKIEIDK